jgi:hypothetical protein
MTIVLDAGAFIAMERGNTTIAALLKRERLDGRVPTTHGGVIGQVWRGGGRQARLAVLFNAVEVVPLDETLGRDAGVLLARAGTSDVIDAALALLANDGDELLTSDVGDLRVLCEAMNVSVDLMPV